MYRHSSAAYALSWTLLSACGGAVGPGSTQIEAQVEAGLAAADSASVWSRASEMSAPIFERDPEVSDLIEGAAGAYALRMTCPQLTRASSSLTVDFGAGCEVGAHTISGLMTLTSASARALLTVDFVQLSDGDRQLDGSLELSLAEALASAQGSLTVTQDGAVTEHLFSGTLASSGQGVTMDGVASRVEGADIADLSFDEVFKAFGDCYPSAGRVTLDRSSSPTVVVTFSASTPSTYEVSVRVGGLPPQTVELPPCDR